MASFNSTVSVDMTNFQLLTTGTTRYPILAAGFAAYENVAGGLAFNAVGNTVLTTLMGPTGTVNSIYVYPTPVSPNSFPPPVQYGALTGISVDATIVDSFLTSSSQETSTSFLTSVLSGNDTIVGSGFNDILFGGAGADSINGGFGTDTVTYAASTAGVFVSLESGLGLRGDAEGDTLYGVENLIGTAFADRLTGSSGDNVLTGGEGNDVLMGGLGADTLDGGDGIDTASYATMGNSVLVDLSGNQANALLAAGDVLVGIENLAGSNYDDLLYGDAGDNRLQGLDGSDFLSGDDGDDALQGGNGNDTINGGNGDDALKGDAGDDVLNGGAGNDRLIGGTGADIMTGGDGNDSYEVDSSGDFVIETADGGTDRVTSNTFLYTLTDNVEVLVLGNGGFVGFGNAQDNTLKGNDFGNSLFGGDGVDTLKGLGGSDFLSGGAGNDRLYGGAGNDTFAFEGTKGGVDRIADWEAGDHVAIDYHVFGIDVSGGLNVVNGTNTASITTDGVFYNSVSGKLYTFDADSHTLTNIAVFATKPAELFASDFVSLAP